MDVVSDLSEVQPGEPEPQGVRAEEQHGPLKLTPLKLRSVEDATAIAHRYASLKLPLDDVNVFVSHLVDRKDSVFFDVGGTGLVYFTSTLPGFMTNFHMVFWDQKLPRTRWQLAKDAMQYMFDEIQVIRIQAFSCSKNYIYNDKLRKLGFTFEGTLRSAWQSPMGVDDMFVFGLLKEDVRGKHK